MTSGWSKQLIKNMLSGSSASLLNVAVIGMTYPIYLHFLGLETYGLWLVLSTVLTFTRLSEFGIGAAVTKVVAEEVGQKKQYNIPKTILAAFVTLGLTTLIPILLLATLADTIAYSFKLSQAHHDIVASYLPLVGPLCLYGLVADVALATLSGLGRMDLAHMFQVGGRAIGSLVAALSLHLGFGLNSLFLGVTCCYTIWILAGTYSIRRRLPDNASVGWEGARAHRLILFGKELFGGSIAGLLLYPFSTWMLTRHAGVGAVPIYDIAFRGAMQVRGLIEVGLRALMPEISRRQARSDDPTEIVALNHQALKIIGVVGLPMHVLLMVAITPLLQIWLGSGYHPSMPTTFMATLTAGFISLLGVPTYYLAMGTGNVRVCFMERLINSTGNTIAILLVAGTTGTLSPLSLGCCMIVGFTLSLSYMLYSSLHYWKEPRAV